MLKIWGRRSAFNVQKVLWLIDELGLEHRHIEAGGAAGGLDDPAFLAMNPHGRVPVIDDGGTVVWESHSILRYLAARYGAGRFWSENPAVRALAERWMDWSQTALQRDFMDLFWGFVRTPVARRDGAAIDRATANCAAHFRLLDGELSQRDWLAGADFTLADIPAGTSLYRYFEMEIDRPEVPHVRAWYERLASRPAYRAQIMRPFGELVGRQDY